MISKATCTQQHLYCTWTVSTGCRSCSSCSSNIQRMYCWSFHCVLYMLLFFQRHGSFRRHMKPWCRTYSSIPSVCVCIWDASDLFLHSPIPRMVRFCKSFPLLPSWATILVMSPNVYSHCINGSLIWWEETPKIELLVLLLAFYWALSSSSRLSLLSCQTSALSCFFVLFFFNKKFDLSNTLVFDKMPAKRKGPLFRI